MLSWMQNKVKTLWLKKGSTIVARKATVTDNTDAVLDAVCGQWIDSRDADAMVHDIYESRVNKDESELLKILGE